MPIRTTTVHNSRDTLDDAPVFVVDVCLPNGLVQEGVEVTADDLPSGDDALIGMDIIGLGDFAVTAYKGGTAFTFRYPPAGRIDFTTTWSERGMKCGMRLCDCLFGSLGTVRRLAARLIPRGFRGGR